MTSQRPVRRKRVPMISRTKHDPQIRASVGSYYDFIEDVYVLENPEFRENGSWSKRWVFYTAPNSDSKVTARTFRSNPHDKFTEYVTSRDDCVRLWKSLSDQGWERVFPTTLENMFSGIYGHECLPFGNQTHYFTDMGRPITEEEGIELVRLKSAYSGLTFHKVFGSVVYWSEYLSIGD